MTATPAAAPLIQTIDVALADIPTVVLARTVTVPGIELDEIFVAELAESFTADLAIIFTAITVWAKNLG